MKNSKIKKISKEELIQLAARAEQDYKTGKTREIDLLFREVK